MRKITWAGALLAMSVVATSWTSSANDLAECPNCSSEEKGVIQKTVHLPSSDYVFSDFPNCQRQGDLAGFLKLVGAGAFQVAPTAGLVIVGSGFVSEFCRKHAGLCSGPSPSSQRQASCATFCTVLSPDKKFSRASFKITDRECGSDLGIGQSERNKRCRGLGHAGWREKRVEIIRGSVFACGTATNWKHDKARKAHIAVYYK
jgi:hypothetical protein